MRDSRTPFQPNSILACPLVDYVRLGLEHFVPAPGSKKMTCETCGSEVWIGVKQHQAKIDHPLMPVMCFVCAGRGSGGTIQHLDGKGSYYGPQKPNPQN